MENKGTTIWQLHTVGIPNANHVSPKVTAVVWNTWIVNGELADIVVAWSMSSTNTMLHFRNTTQVILPGLVVMASAVIPPSSSVSEHLYFPMSFLFYLPTSIPVGDDLIVVIYSFLWILLIDIPPNRRCYCLSFLCFLSPPTPPAVIVFIVIICAFLYVVTTATTGSPLCDSLYMFLFCELSGPPLLVDIIFIVVIFDFYLFIFDTVTNCSKSCHRCSILLPVFPPQPMHFTWSSSYYVCLLCELPPPARPLPIAKQI